MKNKPDVFPKKDKLRIASRSPLSIIGNVSLDFLWPCHFWIADCIDEQCFCDIHMRCRCL